MRNLLLINMAAVALAAGTLMSDRAQATTLGASAGARSAVEAASPVEGVAYYYRRYHRHHAYYPYRHRFRAYGFYPHRFHHRRSWWGGY